jgi:hypothetical protein
MARDEAVTKSHITRRLGFSQQLKFRSALSVKPHPNKIVQYWHGRSRPIADTQESEIYVKYRHCALPFPAPYRLGRSANWVKVKNPKAPAVTREAEEDWRRR